MTRRFATTQWSLIHNAADSANPEFREAMAELCRTYWSPVYTYIRCGGKDAESAQELTQGFFTQLLEKKFIRDAEEGRGRFRSFLLTSVKHYVANEWDRSQTLKRGGAVSILQLDFETEESTLSLEPVERETPETVFEKRWAVSVLKQTMERLDLEMKQAGKQQTFQRLRPLLTGMTLETPYSEIAAELEMTEGALKVTIHRLRKKFGKLLRQEVSRTLSDPTLLDEEMRFLQSALAS